MMEQQQYAQWRQLDLLVLATSASQRQRLDPMVRAEVTGLPQLPHRSAPPNHVLKHETRTPRSGSQLFEASTTEWKSKALRAYQRRTKAADALIASAFPKAGLPVSAIRYGSGIRAALFANQAKQTVGNRLEEDRQAA